MTHVYVVFRGRLSGIYLTWEEYNDQVVCFKRATFKKFKSFEEARVVLESYFDSRPMAGNKLTSNANA